MFTHVAGMGPNQKAPSRESTEKKQPSAKGGSHHLAWTTLPVVSYMVSSVPRSVLGCPPSAHLAVTGWTQALWPHYSASSAAASPHPLLAMVSP